MLLRLPERSRIVVHDVEALALRFPIEARHHSGRGQTGLMEEACNTGYFISTMAIPTSLFGLFTDHADIGPVKHSGTLTFDPARDEYELTAAGTNIWNDRDEFHFAWRRMTGDFIVTAQVRFLGPNVDLHRKIGWMARASLEPDAAHVSATIHGGDGLTSLQFRRTPSAAHTEQIRSPLVGPQVIQLERRGTTYLMSVAHFGETFSVETLDGVDLGDSVYVGLFLTSHNADVVEKAAFHNVCITVPAGENLVPYRDYLGSRMELLTVEDGRRDVIYEEPGCFEAPNWTPDGKDLIYNRAGKLVRFPLATRTPEPIDTGSVGGLNNDHVLSFDGATMGISHRSEAHGGKSVVSTLPVGGGTPTLITPLAPSYLHGWSPDGKTLTYTGERGDGNFDIYSIASDGSGEETRLTTAPGLDDGSEFSPDGQYIYFNSERSGLMQIWRMKPDGSEQEPVTNDGLNNWFPHVSPDGKWIAFLSFGTDVDPGKHPYYKRVYLRLLPTSGASEPRVIAYLYGGQGTINVPSWSPDSTKLAFVSNSGPLP